MTETALPDIALEARSVTRAWGRTTALDGVSVAVRRGRTLALVGESGSGKTTLLRCFNRMVEPDGGEILIGGRPAREADAVQLRRHTGYVPQEGGLLPHWDVTRNVALVPSLLGWTDAGEHARRALDLVGLPASDFGARRPSALSGGQRQRVAIARALAARPPVVLLDEPFGALDAITRAELQDAFLGLSRQLGLTAVLVTHDLREAMRLADTIAVLRAGRIEQEADPRTLLAEPATGYVRQLLGRSHASMADLP